MNDDEYTQAFTSCWDKYTLIIGDTILSLLLIYINKASGLHSRTVAKNILS